MNVIDLLGFLGAAAMLTAFGLTTFGSSRVSPSLVVVLNLVGGGFLALNGAAHHAWPSTAVNTVWLMITLGSVLRLVQARRARRSEPSRSELVGVA